jgi:hypothetical protein
MNQYRIVLFSISTPLSSRSELKGYSVSSRSESVRILTKKKKKEFHRRQFRPSSQEGFKELPVIKSKQ